MVYSDKKSCKIGDSEILHGEFASLFDKYVICNDGRLIENYDNVYGGIAGTGSGGVWDEDMFF
ncbi:MAG TPA: hypothetical protein VEF33_08285 [Syntrophales bacterium]|nr:hypothetical protein [Syntrophales bacterium]